MADILSFPEIEAPKPKPTRYHLDVALYPDHLRFTLNRIKTDRESLLKIASELERIAGIIRSDVVVDTLEPA